nr:ATP synthase F0 subunit 6 [Orthomeria smaragdinum]
MSNIFNIFDPSTSIMSMKMNWISSIMVIMIMTTSYWMMNSRYKMIINLPTKIMNYEFNLLMSKKNKGTMMLFIALLYLITMNNFMGLFPYLFTSTSHLTMTMTLSLPLWMSFMIFGWMKNTKNMFIHLVPLGTPSLLMPFMVCIETISNMIRPITLAVRLTANMIAGHLLLTLLGNTTMSMMNLILPMMILIQIMLLLLETAVAIIQGYVFSVLSILYAEEVN